MDLFASTSVKKTLFLGTYPVLSVLFVVLGVGSSGDPWSVIAASGVIFFIGMLMWQLSGEVPSSASPDVSSVFYFWAWFGSLMYGAVVGGSLLYVILAFFLDAALANLVVEILKKKRFFLRLTDFSDHRMLLGLWLALVLASAVPTSIGLARINHVIDLLSIISFGMVFGWFGPEVFSRCIKQSYGPLIVLFVHLFSLISLYILLEDANPSLAYPTLHLLDALLLSYISCYSMSVSRLVLEIAKLS